jgi:hypothetical protein
LASNPNLSKPKTIVRPSALHIQSPSGKSPTNPNLQNPVTLITPASDQDPKGSSQKLVTPGSPPKQVQVQVQVTPSPVASPVITPDRPSQSVPLKSLQDFVFGFNFKKDSPTNVSTDKTDQADQADEADADDKLKAAWESALRRIKPMINSCPEKEPRTFSGILADITTCENKGPPAVECRDRLRFAIRCWLTRNDNWEEVKNSGKTAAEVIEFDHAITGDEQSTWNPKKGSSTIRKFLLDALPLRAFETLLSDNGPLNVWDGTVQGLIEALRQPADVKPVTPEQVASVVLANQSSILPLATSFGDLRGLYAFLDDMVIGSDSWNAIARETVADVLERLFVVGDDVRASAIDGSVRRQGFMRAKLRQRDTNDDILKDIEKKMKNYDSYKSQIADNGRWLQLLYHYDVSDENRDALEKGVKDLVEVTYKDKWLPARNKRTRRAVSQPAQQPSSLPRRTVSQPPRPRSA